MRCAFHKPQQAPPAVTVIEGYALCDICTRDLMSAMEDGFTPLDLLNGAWQ